ncbi:smalltalk protein [uncultured Bacteroides sp.]|nr:smalltalk protein [uncultured Bacteroides sp.]
MKKYIWKQILQIIITIATSIVSALGVTSCTVHL